MRRVLITGAGRRLGRVLAFRSAAAGHSVVIHYNTSRKEAEQTARDIQEAGGNCVIVGADLLALDTIDPLIAEAEKVAQGPICALINNASTFDYDTPRAPDRTIAAAAAAVNIRAAAQLAAAFIARSDQGRDNVIVNILDQKLWNMNPDFASYTASKAALLSWTTMLDMELGDLCRACAIAPGLLFPSFDQSDEEFHQAANRNLMNRAIDPEDVGQALLYILDAPHFRRQVLHVDNGQRFCSSRRDVMFETRTDR
ncbi:MAG: SDR family NAD(P)-dependent oxidoreductase [Parvularcula sp.]